jgi:hypothetical protein
MSLALGEEVFEKDIINANVEGVQSFYREFLYKELKNLMLALIQNKDFGKIVKAANSGFTTYKKLIDKNTNEAEILRNKCVRNALRNYG